jgi:ADP-ribosylglycohydrolase
MRVAPIPLIYHRNPSVALQNAHLSSQLTHPHPTNTEACQIYTHLITLALSAASKADLAHALTTYPFTCAPLRARFAKYTDEASFALVPEAQIQSSGFVVATLEAALWAFFTTDGFRAGALKAVNLGDDADTVGAVYGGLAGAFYGVEAIPVEWMEGLVKRDLIDDVVQSLVGLVESGEP